MSGKRRRSPGSKWIIRRRSDGRAWNRPARSFAGPPTWWARREDAARCLADWLDGLGADAAAAFELVELPADDPAVQPI